MAPVEASKQKGRRGLGLTTGNFQLESDLGWREEEVGDCQTSHNTLLWVAY